MSGLFFDVEDASARMGLKGPRAAEWLAARGMVTPGAPNTWVWSSTGDRERLRVARLGQSEFFLESARVGGTSDRDPIGGGAIGALCTALSAHPAGVYPVLREDFAFSLGGEGVHDALAQVCNVNFAALDLEPQPVIMTLMIGVAVLVVPDVPSAGPAEAPPAGTEAGRLYRFWCDPTFGPSLSEALRTVIVECGGAMTGVPV
jgi:sarcosine oxidase subunit gamma